MLAQIIAWLRGEIAVESLLADHTKLIAKLEAASAAQVAASTRHNQKASDAAAKAAKAEAEALRANNIAYKLKGIFA
jgi:hypothetical protein